MSELKRSNDDGGAYPADNCGFEVEIVPPELWDVIFQKLENPKDLLSVWNSSSASVWTTALRSSDFYSKMILPFVLPYLKQKDFLECSLVSKSWNSSVDAYMQSAEDFDSSSRLTPEQLIELPFHSATNMSDFINRFSLQTNNQSREKSVAVNPVVFRRVFVTLETNMEMERNPRQPELEGNNEEFSELKRNLIQCLDHFGHFIRYFHLDMSLDTVNFFEKLKLVQSCLMRMPNLRVLKIDSFSNDDNVPHGCDLEVEFEVFKVYNSYYPWPELEHLKVLKFGEYTKRKELSTISVAYAAQLLRLDFDHLNLVEPDHEGTYRFFPRLQKVVHSCSESFNGFEFVIFLKHSQSPLKHLRVELPSHGGDGETDVQTSTGMKLAADAVSETLETLIFCPTMEVDNGLNFSLNFDRVLNFEVYFPQLKVLELIGCAYPDLEVLRHVCPALQKLIVLPSLPEPGGCVILQHFVPYHIRIIIQEGEKYANLYSKHKLWNELTQLQSVDVKFKLSPKIGKKIRKIPEETIRKVYTRLEYEAKLKKDRQMETNKQVKKQSSTSKKKKNWS